MAKGKAPMAAKPQKSPKAPKAMKARSNEVSTEQSKGPGNNRVEDSVSKGGA